MTCTWKPKVIIAERDAEIKRLQVEVLRLRQRVEAQERTIGKKVKKK